MNPALFVEKYIHDKYVYNLLAIKLLNNNYNTNLKEYNIIKNNIIHLQAPLIVYDFIENLLNISKNDIHKLQDINVNYIIKQINILKNDKDKIIKKNTMITTKFEMKDKLDNEIDELYNKYNNINISYLQFLIGMLL
jgi:hypothetical protein